MFKRFRIHVKWFDGYETKECYYYRLGYRNLGKFLLSYYRNSGKFFEGEEIVEICELVKTFKSFKVCLTKTCSWDKNKCI